MADEMPDGLWYVLTYIPERGWFLGAEEYLLKEQAIKAANARKAPGRIIKLAHIAFDSVEDFDG